MKSHGSREGSNQRFCVGRDALLAEGIDVTTITSSQFANVCEFSTLMGEVSQKAGKVFRGWRPGQIEKHMSCGRTFALFIGIILRDVDEATSVCFFAACRFRGAIPIMARVADRLHAEEHVER